MCGIGGIVGGDLRVDERETAALRMRAALRHRGPDDEALAACGNATLVHTRLAILDLTPAGAQPITRGPLTLTFNGEIYNFRALRDDLVRRGESFASSTDTEVLLALYARHGAACLSTLRGMFAFAVWDARDQSCFLARDPFGIKPLYYTTIPGHGLLFASELRALLATRLVPRRIDATGLEGYLATGSVPEPHTMVSGVSCLPAGHWLRWRDGTLRARAHATVGFDSKTAREENDIDLGAALQDSVEHHLVSDVPVGVLLSGGLDSSALLALTQRRSGGNVTAFSLGVEDPRLDESDAARALARHFGVPHREMLLTQELARHWIDDFLDSIDQPTLDGFNVYCACKLASDHGCPVVLSGLGADELFGGYPSFHQVPVLYRTTRLLGPIRPLIRGLSRLSPDPRSRRVCEFLGGTRGFPNAYAAFRGVFTSAEIAPLMGQLAPGLGAGAQAFASDESERESAREDWGDLLSHLELTRYLRNQLLRDADVMSMAHGVELRVPLLDLPLFAVLRAIPSNRRLAGSKQLLREAVPELPVGLLAPRKRGFSLPFDSWLKSEWSDLADGFPLLRQARPSPWYRQWTLLVLLHWLRKHDLHAV